MPSSSNKPFDAGDLIHINTNGMWGNIQIAFNASTGNGGMAIRFTYGNWYIINRQS